VNRARLRHPSKSWHPRQVKFVQNYSTDVISKQSSTRPGFRLVSAVIGLPQERARARLGSRRVPQPKPASAGLWSRAPSGPGPTLRPSLWFRFVRTARPPSLSAGSNRLRTYLPFNVPLRGCQMYPDRPGPLLGSLSGRGARGPDTDVARLFTSSKVTRNLWLMRPERGDFPWLAAALLYCATSNDFSTFSPVFNADFRLYSKKK